MSSICCSSRHGCFSKLLSFSPFRHLLHYSTIGNQPEETTTNFMVDYLKGSLGFSTVEAMAASTKLIHLKSTAKPDLVIKFFKEMGFADNHIRRIVSRIPRLLTSNVEKTLKPKVRVFQDLGLSGFELGDLASGEPFLFETGLNTRLLPTVVFLETVLGSKENAMKAIKRTKWLLSCDTQGKMQPNIELLRNYGLSDRGIQKLILEDPRSFLLKPSRLEKILATVEGEFAIPRDSWMFIYAIKAISSLSKSTLESKFEIFKSFGWSKSDIMTMIRNLPKCLSLSESKIRYGLDFLMKQLGYVPEYIASHPKLLMYSFEKRIEPRNVVLKALKEKNLIKTDPSLYWIVNMREDQFVKDILSQLKDEIPDVYEDYIRRVGASTKPTTRSLNGL